MAFEKKLEQMNTQAIDSIAIPAGMVEFRPIKPSQVNVKMTKRFASGREKMERIRKAEEAIKEQGTISKETLLERLGKSKAS